MNIDVKVAMLTVRGDTYRRALGAITELYPPDTDAGKLAADAIVEGDKYAVHNPYRGDGK